ncbi:uncharacterized protein [Sinocyclocheilus grahami]|uniref:uncharacterized protein n=1 Tax=Sinocyclocheilus grahami TaxID=75366 RepID=UPI0007AD26F0|nr:PREDICTED: uncharacterized protein LOC107562484 [Sinocyclocheilus grahami]
MQLAMEKNIQGYRPQVKWPKSGSKKEWTKVNADPSKILNELRGTAEKKLDKMSDLVYSYGVERFGAKERGKKKNNNPSQVQKAARNHVPGQKEKGFEKTVEEILTRRVSWHKPSASRSKGTSGKTAESRKRCKKKERTRTSFYKDPFRFVKALFTKEKSGSLKVSKKELEDHLKATHTDSQIYEQRVIPPDMPPIPQPEHQLDDSPPRWSEVEKTVRKPRATSAPGPNGVPYRLYKNAPEVLRFLWRQMKVVWKKQTIPKTWRRAGGVLIPKEKDALNINQFRKINLLNVEGKIFFSIVPQRMTTYLKQNKLIDTSIQKAGIPGFSGCLEHTSMIWVVGGERLQSGQHLPPIRAYMDDMATLTSTIACTKRLLAKLHANITWARMKLKPSKSRSISIVRRKLIDQRFHIDETPIPMVQEMPVKSFGQWYNASFKDSDQSDQLREETIGPFAPL